MISADMALVNLLVSTKFLYLPEGKSQARDLMEKCLEYLILSTVALAGLSFIINVVGALQTPNFVSR